LKLKLAEASDVGVDASSVSLPPQPARYNDRVINKIPLVFIIAPIYNSI
jgi:hypothetical protein